VENSGLHQKKKERERLFSVRKSALFASTALQPGSTVWTTDVCVPVSKLAQCISETKQDLSTSSVLAPLVGHVGDGNFHLFILIDPKDPLSLEEAKRINSRLILRALEMDGTSTGEHGVGIGKKEYLEKELGIEALNLMRKIKVAIDPLNIMNPGKKISLDNYQSKPTQQQLQGDIQVNTNTDNNGCVSISIIWPPKRAKL